MDDAGVKLSEEQVHRVELALSYLLRGGVLISTAIVLMGLILMFIHHPEYITGNLCRAQCHPRHGISAHRSTKCSRVSALDAEGRAVVIVGLFVLIATPVVLRAPAVSVVIFFHQKDRLFTGITLVVLILLLASFLLGKAGG